MAYDYEGAKKAGLTDAQIAQHLAQKTGYRYDAAKAAGLDDSAIVQHLLQKDSQPQLISTPPLATRLRNRAVAELPNIGGFAGGIGGAMLGGVPGGIGGAAVGGAAGEAAQQAILGHPLDAGRIATQGAAQGAYEVAGGAIAKVAGKAARPVMRRALGVGKSILKDFPDAVETTLKNRIPVSAKGAAKATRLREGSAAALTRLLEDASKKGTTFKTSEVTRHVKELLDNNALPDEDWKKLSKQLSAFVIQHGKSIEPTLLQDIKRLYAERASYATAIGKAKSNKAEFSEAIAKGARRELEKIPGVAEQNRTTQSLIGAERAVQDAHMRAARPFEIHKPGSYPLVNNPHVTSRVAIVMADPGFQRLLKQSPRSAAFLLQLMQSDQPDATDQP